MGRRRNSHNAIRTRARSEADATGMPHPDSDEGSGLESPHCSQRARAASEPNYVGDQRGDFDRLCEKPSSARGKKKQKKSTSILDHMLRQEDSEGMGITRAATTEICLLLWMMMEAGQAWTAMALNLLSMDEEAGWAVQEEVDNLVNQYGKDRLFTSFVLGKMDKMDALIYEAIRLCPQFFGGMKVVKQTVEVGGFQIPKNTNVIFCNPTEDKFDLDSALGKRPEAMGMNYPSVEL
jgi:cytochrome P450